MEELDADDLATGCPYYPRCPLPDRAQVCDIEGPKLTEIEPGHFVACRRYTAAP